MTTIFIVVVALSVAAGMISRGALRLCPVKGGQMTRSRRGMGALVYVTALLPGIESLCSGSVS